MSLRDTRIDYNKGTLGDEFKDQYPFEIFENWLALAKEKVKQDYNAMALSTFGLDGFPACRIVLLRGASKRGLVFYTNYLSHKGKELDANQKVSVNFFWRELEKQIRVNGVVEKLPAEISDVYFSSRPRKSQIGAWVSDQSSIIGTREELQAREKEMDQRFKGADVPRPEHWGGYIIKPVSYEFWQGRSGRLHDRLRFNATKEGWSSERLSP